MADFICVERLAFGPWPALERAIARLLEHGGFKDVLVVGGAGDHGADVVGTLDGVRWLVQAKFRGASAADSAGPREAVRAMTAYDARVAIAATNSKFTEDAYGFREATVRNGVDLRLWNGAFLRKYADSLRPESSARRSLRSYQAAAVESVEERRSAGKEEALVIMATGLGKSLVASELVLQELQRNPAQEVLVLAHTKDLVRQLERSFWSQLEKGHPTHLWTDGEEPSFRGGVVFATWQSVNAALARGEPLEGRFGLVVVDEAHHAPSQAFRRLLSGLSPRFLLGLTATPWRGDEQRLDDLFGSPTYVMDIIDGMQQGFLADVDYRLHTDGIDWDDIARRSKSGLTVKDLNTLLLMPERDVAMVSLISEHMRTIPNARALGFCRSIEHAERLQPLFASFGVKTSVLHSRLSREERFKRLSSFRSGSIDFMLSVEMLNEGIDVPEVNLVAFMRVTHSRRIFIQQLGRGLRLSPEKSKVVVLDFVADIRRVAAGLSLNRDAAERAREKEIVRFADGQIISFDTNKASAFFDEYLADVASIEDLDQDARLRFPSFEEQM